MPLITDEDDALIDCMRKYGGSFVQQLAELWRYADYENKQKIRNTWHNYFEDYKKFLGVK